MRAIFCLLLSIGPLPALFGFAAADISKKEEQESLKACASLVLDGFRKIADTRDVRFQGKVKDATALCRGGQMALQFRNTPWVDWSNYWGAGDATTRPHGLITAGGPSLRGINGALFDLEYQRIELIKFNLFDNNKTYEAYVTGRDGEAGPVLNTWPEMRLPPEPSRLHTAVGATGSRSVKGDLIRFRTLDRYLQRHP